MLGSELHARVKEDTKMDNEGLNRKLAEWAGFKSAMGSATLYDYPNRGRCSNLPNFTQSLDACFKWLVPKLDEWGLCLQENEDSDEPTDFMPYAQVSIKRDGKWVHKGVYNKNSALALCLAISKVIEQEIDR